MPMEAYSILCSVHSGTMVKSTSQSPDFSAHLSCICLLGPVQAVGGLQAGRAGRLGSQLLSAQELALR